MGKEKSNNSNQAMEDFGKFLIEGFIAAPLLRYWGCYHYLHHWQSWGKNWMSKGMGN